MYIKELGDDPIAGQKTTLTIQDILIYDAKPVKSTRSFRGASTSTIGSRSPRNLVAQRERGLFGFPPL